jgi:hypothetical protein
MLYQLPNGKVIEMTTEQFVEMSDEELEYLIAFNYGDSLENPWFGSVLTKGPRSTTVEIDENIPDLTDLSCDEKLLDLDLDKDVFENE